MTNREIKVWVIVDKNDNYKPFTDIKHRFHILKTKKSAQEYIKEQFFPAKAAGWRIKKMSLLIK